MFKFTLNSVLVISINFDSVMRLKVIEYKTDEKSFSITLIDDLNKTFDIKEKKFDSFSISAKDSFVILAHEFHLFLVDLKTRTCLCQANSDIKDSRFTKIFPITNTNNFISLTDSEQIAFISYYDDSKQLTIKTHGNLKAAQIAIYTNILVIYDGSNKLSYYNIANLVKFESPVSQIQVENLKYFTMSPECNYLATYETPKSLSLYRLKDFSKCACISLYCEVTKMVISEKYVSLGMKNKRFLSFLIVDPLENEHKTRIGELPSRYYIFHAGITGITYLVHLIFNLKFLFYKKSNMSETKTSIYENKLEENFYKLSEKVDTES